MATSHSGCPLRSHLLAIKRLYLLYHIRREEQRMVIFLQDHTVLRFFRFPRPLKGARGRVRGVLVRCSTLTPALSLARARGRRENCLTLPFSVALYYVLGVLPRST
jgi:hypothetical protein